MSLRWLGGKRDSRVCFGKFRPESRLAEFHPKQTSASGPLQRVEEERADCHSVVPPRRLFLCAGYTVRSHGSALLDLAREEAMRGQSGLAAVLLVGLATLSAQATDAPITRTPLQSAETPEAAHSAQSYLVSVAPHAVVARHTHPGVEMGYCVSGGLTVSVAGQPDRQIKAGDSWVFPVGTPHSLANTGEVPAQLVVTFVVEKDKPLSSPAP
ncbi:cupin domain-containing protein [Methylobacterium sp. J-030]|uniref:cupin domain-containing protein n=1 Tax=Methylobacterium sp. J-030 TaxID=2836627 RepID=UPI001FB9E31C|nr:cupin domain-containing protein [Methylobacterium sp. J-030]MCJ2068256.1 cupin domain-containing protein [Methylobacterium sp. J-030]